MRIRERALALAAVWLLAAGAAFAEVDLFDIQKDLALGKSTVSAPAGTKEADLKAIAECLEDAEGITLDLSVTHLKAIPDKAFVCCTALKAVILPKGLVSIGKDAFHSCTGLTSVEIPEGVTSIGDSAFSVCKSLTSVVIPASVTSIGKEAFKWCSRLAKIDVAPNNKSYASIDGVLFSKDKTTLICYPAGKADEYYEIPKGTENIDDYAFDGCTRLKVVKIPDGVTSIGVSAFWKCKSLTSIAIPAGVTSIGSGAFSGCKSLTSIVIPASVKSIGEWAFQLCESLTSVMIPASVTSIGSNAFNLCKRLATVTFGDTDGWYADEGLTESVAAWQLASRVKGGKALYKRAR